MTEIIFAEGISYKKPHPNAPDFVKGSINIKVADLVAFLNTNIKEDGWVNLDMKQNKAGNIYLSLNTFVPEKQNAEQPHLSQGAYDHTPKADSTQIGERPF